MKGPTEIDGVVEPAQLYHPTLMVTKNFKTWALRCGKCGKDFVRFAFWGKPRCPYCGTRNAPQLTFLG